MGKKISALWNFVSHYKYFIVVVIGVAIVGFIDDNSFMHRMQYEMQISELKAELEHYREQNEADMQRLKSMGQDPKVVERIAREQYFKKADDEDVYVFSDEE